MRSPKPRKLSFWKSELRRPTPFLLSPLPPDPEFPVPEIEALPRHVAIIMDGNGRWAQQRKLPRTAGHQAGVKAVREVVEFCGHKGIMALTLFAFSRENWNRPESEIGSLMELFLKALKREADSLAENHVRLRFVGDRSALSGELQKHMALAEEKTAVNDERDLIVAVNYGGRWDIVQAARYLGKRIEAGELRAEQIDAGLLGAKLTLADLPEPDLFIRSGGNQRISNFMLWQLAYTELYFTEVLWPDFGPEEMEKAIAAYAGRQRRFGERAGLAVHLRRQKRDAQVELIRRLNLRDHDLDDHLERAEVQGLDRLLDDGPIIDARPHEQRVGELVRHDLYVPLQLSGADLEVEALLL